MNISKAINQLRFNQYAAYLKQQGLSDASIKRKLSSLSSFQKFLVKKKILVPDSKPIVPSRDVLQNVSTNKKSLFPRFAFRTYLLAATLLIILAGLGYSLYSQVIYKARTNLAYSTAASTTTPNRILSFQGRLTDSSGNPISSSTGIVFRLFNAGTGGTELYVSDTGNSQTVIPDENGIFSVVIGKTHGAVIPSSVFSENAEVWLQITAGGETMDPRQQIATVAYALNSETLQGLPPSASGFKDTVLVIDGSGNLNLGETSPTIKSTSGTLGIEGQAVLLKASDGSGGNITINPDGEGKLKLITEGLGSTAVGGFVEATNANLASGNLYSGLIRNDNRSYNFIDFSNFAIGTTSVTSQFSVNAYGNLTTAGTINTSIGITSPQITLSVGASNGFILQSDASGNATWVNASTAGIGSSYDVGSGLSRTGNIFKFGGPITENTRLNIGNTEVMYINSSNGYIGIGTTSPANKLVVTGTGSTAGQLAIYNPGGNIGDIAGIDLRHHPDGRTQAFIRDELLSGYATNLNFGTASGINNASIKMTLSSAGNLGIGITTPLYKLHLSGDEFISGKSTIGLGSTNPLYTLNVGGTTSLIDLHMNGLFGLGTTSPTYKLELVGSNSLLRIGDTAGNDLVNITESNAQFNLPTTFTSAGDVSLANDLNFTNSTASYIRSQSPLYIQTEHPTNNINLVLSAANSGVVLIDDNAQITSNLAVGGTFTLSVGASSGYVLQSDASGNAAWVSAVGIGGTYTANNGLTLTGSNFQLGGALTQNTRLNIGNTEVMYFQQSTGNIGIGTTNPGSLLDIKNKIKVTSSSTLGISSATYNSINQLLDVYGGNIGVASESNTDGAIQYGLVFTNAYYASTTHPVASINLANNYPYIHGAGNLVFQTQKDQATNVLQERMRIDNNGNVGIGTTAPGSLLNVYGAASGTAEITVSGGGSGYHQGALVLKSTTDTNYRGLGTYMFDAGGQTEWYAGRPFGLNYSSDSFAIVRTASTANHNQQNNKRIDALFLIDSSGNLGLGVTSPSKKLDVAGDINLTGTIFTAGTSGTSGQVLSSTGTGLQWINASSVGGTYVFANGLTNNGTFVGLGGTLTQNTNIGVSSFGLNFVGLGGTALSGVDSRGILFSNGGTDAYNVYIGNSAGNIGSTAPQNTGVGWRALQSLTTGSYNSAFGSSALRLATTGTSNSAFGASSMLQLTIGGNNSAIGSNSLYALTSGSGNSAIGTGALYGITTSSDNIGMGINAGRNLSDGTSLNQTGYDSIFIGKSTRAFADGQNNQIVIGNYATGLGNNSVVLGNDSIVTTALKGNVGIGTTNPGSKLTVAGGDIALDDTKSIYWGNGATQTYQTVNAGWMGYFYSGSKRLQIDLNTSSYNAITSILTNLKIGTSANNTDVIISPKRNAYLPSGNFGIGVTSPTKALDVSGDINLTGTIFSNGASGTSGQVLSSTGTGLQWIDATSVGSTYSFSNGLTLSGSTVLFGGTLTQNTRLNIGNTEVMYVDYATGNIGLGRTNPSVKLDINADSGIKITSTTNSNKFLTISHNGSEATLQSTAATGAGYSLSLEGQFVRFKTYGASGWTEKMRIDEVGNVGIGTTNPTYKLHVMSSGTTSAGLLVAGGSTIYGPGAANAHSGEMILGDIGSQQGRLSYDYARANLYLNNAYDGASTANGNIFFQTKTSGTAVDALTIQGSGNVGIGTTNPTTKLHVASGSVTIENSGTDGVLGDVLNFAAIGYPSTYLNKIRSTNTGSDSSKNKLVFSISNGTSSNQVDVLSLVGTGNVGIGTTNPGSSLDITFPTSGGSTSPMANNAINLLNQYSDANAMTGIRFQHATSGGIKYTPSGIFSYRDNASTTRTAKLGFFVATSDNISNSSERMTIDSAGNVGIGTTNPLNNLHINSGSNTSLKIESTGTNSYPSVSLKNTAEEWNLYNDGSNGNIFGLWNVADNTYRFAVSPNGNIGLGGNIVGSSMANANLTILNSGNVGIGTTAPSAKLHVASGDIYISGADQLIKGGPNLTGDYGSIEFYDGNTGNMILTSSQLFNFSVVAGGLERMRITSTGNVGIGTTAPSKKLDVAGDINLTGTIFSNGASGTSGQVLSSTGTGLQWVNASSVGGTYVFANGLTNNGTFVGLGGTLTQNTRLNIGNTEVMYIDYATGNVGIGNTSPTAGSKMDIRQNGNQLILTAASDQNYNTKISANYSAAHPFNINVTTGGGAGTELIGAYSTNKTALMYGNVGIATTTPIDLLNIVSNGGGLTFSAYANGTYNNSIVNNMVDSSPATTRMLFKVSDGSPSNQVSVMSLNGNGNVGIGTTAPSKKLDVAGDINLTGTIFTAGTSGTSGQVLSSTGTGLQWVNASSVGGTYVFANGLTNNGTFVGLGGTLTQNTNINTGANSLSFLGLGNTQSLFIGATGFVGIGNANPQTTLHLGMIGTNQPAIRFTNQNIYSYQFATTAGNNFQLTNVNTSGTVLNVGASTLTLSSTGGANDTSLSLNNTTGATVFNNNLSNIFTIQGSNNKTMANFTQAGGGLPYGNLGIYNNTTQTVLITGNGNSYFNGGNVGIGTTNPNSKFVVLNAGPTGTVTTIADFASSTYDTTNNWNMGLALRLGGLGTGTEYYHSRIVSYLNPNWSFGSKLQLQTHANNLTDWNSGILIDENGNVGIGTTAPSKKLDVAGDINLTGTIFSNGTSGTSGQVLSSTGTGLQWVNASSVGGTYVFSNGLTNNGTFVGLGGTLTQNTRLNIGNTEVMYIDYTTGNIGLGTTNTTEKLTLSGGSFRILGGGAIYLGTNTAQNGTINLPNNNAVNFRNSTNSGDITGLSVDSFNNTVVGGGNRLVVSTSGNVGIGTTNPAAKLSIYGADGVANGISIGNTSGHDWRIFSDAPTVGLKIGGASGTQNFWESTWGGTIANLFKSPSGASASIPVVARGATGQTANLFQVQSVGGTGLAAFDANGNLGLGTTNPNKKLSLYTSDNDGVEWFRNNGTYAGWVSRAVVGGIGNNWGQASLTFKTAGAGGSEVDTLTLLNGSVGIGTTAPSKKLDVAGDINLTGTIFTAGTSGTSGQVLSSTGAGLQWVNASSVGGTYVFNNGLTNNAGTVGLGGTLTSNTNLTIGNTSVLFLGTNGNVGIGTTNPLANLDIAKVGGAEIILQDTNDGWGDWKMKASDSLTFYGGSYNGNPTQANIMFGYGGTLSTRLGAMINVGAQTTNFTPVTGTSLYVRDSSTAPSTSIQIDKENYGSPSDLTFTANNSYYYAKIRAGDYGGDQGKIAFYTGTASLGSLTEKMRLDTNGNVGIGTTAPSKKLDVAGDINLTGTIFSNGASGTSGQVLSSTGTGLQWVNASSIGGTYVFNNGLTNNAGTVGLGGTLIQNTNLTVGNTSALFINSTSGYVGLGTITPVAKLQISGTSTSSDSIGAIVGAPYSVGGTSYGSFGSNSRVGLVGSAYYSSPISLPTNPFGSQYASVGLAGFAGGTANGATPVGVYGLGQAVGLSTGRSVGGRFLANANGDLNVADNFYGIYTEGDGSTNTVGSDNVYGSYNKALGSANDTTYGGYFTASGGASNFGIYSAAGTNYFNGNVGIGTTSPGYKLDVNGNARVNSNLYITGTGKLAIADTDSNGTFNLGYNSNRIYLSSDVGNQSLNLLDNGYVGIGTTNPLYKFQVQGPNSDFYVTGGTTASIGTSIGSGASIDLYNMSTGYMNFNANNSSGGFGFNVNSSEKMRLTRDGYLGIGTTSPTKKLDVAGDINLTGTIFSNGTSGTSGQVLSSTGTGLQWVNAIGLGQTYSVTNGLTMTSNVISLGGTLTGNTNIGTSSFNLNIGQGNTQALFISSGGNVGIGSTNPTQKLDVNGTSIFRDSATVQKANNVSLSIDGNVSGAYSGLKINSNTSPWYIGMQDNLYGGGLNFNTAGFTSTPQMIISRTGNVGIGTTNPSKALDVAGDINLTGTIFSNGTSGTSGQVLSSTGTGLQWVNASGLGQTYSVTNGLTMNSNVISLGGTLTQNTNLTIGNTSVLFINGTNGNIGLGTTSPAYTLDVLGGSNPLVNFKSTTGPANVYIDTVGSRSHLVLKYSNGTTAGAINGNSTGIQIGYGAAYATNIALTALLSNGNVGIGTTNPTQKLDINGSLNIGGSMAIGSTQLVTNLNADMVDGLHASDLVGIGSTGSFIYTAGTGLTLSATNVFSLNLGNTNTWLAPQYFDNNVGIGTTNPQAKLDINVGSSTDLAYFRRTQTGSDYGGYITFMGGVTGTGIRGYFGFIGNNGATMFNNEIEDAMALRASGAIQLGSGSLAALTIDTNNNIGLGTTAPSKKLDVAGDINLTGTIFSNGTSGTSGQVLSSTGTGLQWIDATSVGSTYSFSNGLTLSGSTVLFGGTLTSNTNLDTNGFNLNIGQGNTQALFISSAGNVGIGTTNPTHALEVNSSIYINSGNVMVNRANSTGADAYSYYLTGGTAKWLSGMGATGGVSGQNTYNLVYYNGSSWLNRFIIDQNGNVGIGTTNPTEALLVMGNIGASGNVYANSGNVQVGIRGGFNGLYTGQNDMALTHWTGSDYRQDLVILANNGSVGIGTTNPGKTLDIVGTLRASSSVTFQSGGNSIFDTSNGFVMSQAANSSSLGLVVRGRSSQTANLTEWQDSSGSAMIVFDKSGNVGIGTTSPSKKLDVAGDINLTGTIFTTGTSGTSGQVLSSTGTGLQWVNATGLGQTYSVTNGLNMSGNVIGLGGTLTQNTNLTIGNTSVLYLSTNGNVGIGTTSPNQILSVGNSNQFTVDGSGNVVTNGNITPLNNVGGSLGSITRYWSTSYIGGIDLGSNNLSGVNNVVGYNGLLLSTAGTDKSITVTPSGSGYVILNGNVGIGTTSPSKKLDVAGDINLTGTIFSNGTSGTSGQVLSSTGTGLQWVNASGLGQTYSVTNGLNMTGNVIGLGGTLTGNTSIGTSSFSLNIGQGNTQSLFISSSGNVGIGTTNPQNKLQVAGNIVPDTNLTYDLGTSGLRFNNTWTKVLNIGSSTWSLQSPDNSRFSFFNNSTGGTETLTILSNGNVGIGTTAPAAKLEVNGDFLLSQSSQLSWKDGGGTGHTHITSSNYDLSFGLYYGSTDMKLTTTGLGIGTTSPSKKLDVAGDVNLTGTIFTAGTSGTSGQVLSSTGTGLQWVNATSVGSTYSFSNGLTLSGSTVLLGGTLTQNTQIGTSDFSLSFVGLGGTQSLHIDETGNVGINSTNPDNPLTIDRAVSNTPGNGFISFRNSANTNQEFALRMDAGTYNLSLDSRNSGLWSTMPIMTWERLNLRVGIGTTSPGYKLDVVGNIRVQGDTDPLIVYGATPDIRLNFDLPSYAYATINARNKVDNASRDLNLQTDGGNVGIGTTNPSQKLDINGSLNIGGSMAIGSTQLVTNLNADLLDGVHASNFLQTGYTGFDKYSSWNLQSNGAGTTAITSAANVNFVNGVGISLTQSGSTITINNTGVGATYAATNGLTLTGSSFGLGGTLTQNVNLNVGNTSALFINGTNGNVGIGMTNPLYKFTVSGTQSNVSFIRNITITDAGTTAVTAVGSTFTDTDSGKILLWSDSTSRNIVGVNVTSPETAYIDSAANIHATQSVGLYNPNFYVGADGRVGVNTTNNTAQLTVNGDIVASKFASLYDYSRYFLDPGNTSSTNSSLSLHGNGSLTFNVETIGGVQKSIFAAAATRLKSYANGFGIATNIGATTAGGDVTWSEALFVKNNGNVGIGTTNPAAKLEIAGSSSMITNTTGDITLDAASGNISFSSDNLINFGRAIAGSGTSGAPAFSFGSDSASGLYSLSSGVIGIATTGTERLRIDNIGNITIGNSQAVIINNVGNVGIGTTNPIFQLHVKGWGQTTANLADSSTATGGTLYLQDSAGTANTGGTIIFGNNNGNLDKRWAAIKALLTDGSNNATGSLAFSTRTNSTDTALSEKMRIINSGNVGIGTTNPLWRLHVNTGTNQNLGIAPGPLYGSLDGIALISANDINNTVQDLTLAGKNVIFNVSRVGIGTTNPTSSLHLASNVSNTNPSLTYHSTNAWSLETASIELVGGVINASPWTYWLQARSSANWGAPLSLNPVGGNVGIGTTNPSATLSLGNNVATGFLDNFSEYQQLLYTSATAATSYGFGIKAGTMVFNTNGAYSFDRGGGATSLYINSSDYVGIGTTNPTQKLDVGGYMIVGNSNYTYLYLRDDDSTNGVKSIHANSDVVGFLNGSGGWMSYLDNAGTWHPTSDARLKKNVQSLTGVLDKINQIRGVSFNWIDPIRGTNTNLGVIAQEVEPIFPELVSTDSDGIKHVSYETFAPVLIQGIKELDTKIEGLSVADNGQINVNFNVSSEVLATLGYSDTKNEIETATYSTTDSTGSVVTRLANFAQLTVGKINAGLVSATNLVTKNIVAETTKSKVVKTDLIAPLDDVTDTINIGGTLVAEELRSDKLISNSASISGTLYADKVISKEGDFGEVLTDKITALRDELRTVIASTTLPEPSTPSAIALESQGWTYDVATSQVTVTGDMSLSNNLVIGAKLSVLGDTQLANAFITGTFTAGEIAIKDNLIETTNTALYIQPSGLGLVDIMDHTLVIAENGTVTVNGNLGINGSITASEATVSGSLFANLINAEEINTKKINVATDSATAAPIIAESGFAALATNSAQVDSNAAAGIATLPAGKTELVINNSKITSTSIVYLTPAGSTNNQVVYLKSKTISPAPSPTETPESTTSATPTTSNFVIAIDQPLANDIQVNWWIIN